MKLSHLALAAVLAAVSTALPPYARADHDKGHEGSDEREVRIEVRHEGGRDDDGGDREDGRRDRRDQNEGKGGREGRGNGHHGMDPALKEQFMKTRELERKLHDLSKSLRQGSDPEKAAAKTEARKTLGELFDAKLALETLMLDKMEKRAAELKAKISKKKSSREKAIESRLARMTGEGDEW